MNYALKIRRLSEVFSDTQLAQLVAVSGLGDSTGIIDYDLYKALVRHLEDIGVEEPVVGVTVERQMVDRCKDEKWTTVTVECAQITFYDTTDQIDKENEV